MLSFDATRTYSKSYSEIKLDVVNENDAFEPFLDGGVVYLIDHSKSHTAEEIAEDILNFLHINDILLK